MSGTFRAGDVVRAHFLDGEWYMATVEECFDNDTYQICWFDGDARDVVKGPRDLVLMRFVPGGTCWRPAGDGRDHADRGGAPPGDGGQRPRPPSATPEASLGEIRGGAGGSGPPPERQHPAAEQGAAADEPGLSDGQPPSATGPRASVQEVCDLAAPPGEGHGPCPRWRELAEVREALARGRGAAGPGGRVPLSPQDPPGQGAPACGDLPRLEGARDVGLGGEAAPPAEADAGRGAEGAARHAAAAEAAPASPQAEADAGRSAEGAARHAAAAEAAPTEPPAEAVAERDAEGAARHAAAAEAAPAEPPAEAVAERDAEEAARHAAAAEAARDAQAQKLAGPALPGCAQCGLDVSIHEKAEDGKRYCDACWIAWPDALTEPQRAAALRRVETARRAAQERAVRSRELQAQREDEYWRARRKQARAPAPRPSAEQKVPVVFWGICDLKYDPREPERERVKVLELGDGRYSKFSHHGAVIKETMEGAYCMGKQPLKKGVMVDNKRLMHDTFVQCGLAFMRPKQFAYPRKYSPGLAERIKSDLCVGKGGAVVLKLVNRARGAGVLVCPAVELDATLKQLLQVPAGNDMEMWLQRQAPRAVKNSWSGSPLDEQRLHYWSNESPVFVAEELCRSEPVSAPLLGGARAEGAFDGTMRVAFALRQRGAAQDGLELEWLGGYWKLPPSPAEEAREEAREESGGLSAEQLHACTVSSFNTEEKRTAEVPETHLQEVYATLGPALSRVFELDFADWQVLINSYPDEAAFRAFVLCRCAANLRGVGQWDRSWWLLDRAARHVQDARPKDAGCLPERAVLSYVERTRGTNYAMREEWGKAIPYFERALDLLPSNASAYYLKGVAFQERQKWEKAAACHLRALALDPDFRTPSMALSECWSREGRFELAIEASLACLHRQPDAAVAQYNMAQAVYQMLRRGHQATEEELRRLRRLALDNLEAAESSPFFPEDKWTEVERQMRRYFRAGRNRETLPRQPLKSCKTYAWRP